MAQNIIAIIGARKVGKTVVADTIRQFYPDYRIISPLYCIIDEFLKVHEMTAESFREDAEQNRKLLFLYKEWKDRPVKFFNQFLADLNNVNHAIVDDIYTFYELDALIKLQAKVILIESSVAKRQEFGYISGMDTQFYTQEVASISAQNVKTWANTLTIENSKTISDLRLTLRNKI